MKDFSEDQLVERPAVELFDTLDWECVNAFEEELGEGGTLVREERNDVVLKPRLRAALERLNADVPVAAIDEAMSELVRDRRSLSAYHANKEVHELLRDGVRVEVMDDSGKMRPYTVQVVDWKDASRNDFLLVSQLWVSGDVYTRRADLVGFVNGLPLVFIELKAAHKNVRRAFDENLRDYKVTIPQLFWYNQLLILSNGREAKIGTITSEWEHFADWKKVEDENEEGKISLERMIRGTCQKDRLLDLVENFVLFDKRFGGIKVLAKNHQYLGVNRAVEAVKNREQNQGKLGVFWHTQGSGKSFSMTFFSRKVLRKVPGNWTFVVVTDRTELDDQIYGTFEATGAVTEAQAQATSGAHLKELLRGNHRYIFTLIHKFGTAAGDVYPELSDRSDIIVMADEAHRTQYDTLAYNLHRAIPNAGFIAFTGTPLIAGEERTREVFGDYISIYNFRDAIADQNTVPLYYENRIPELRLADTDFVDELDRIIDEANLDEEQEEKLERELGREYQLITRRERLEAVARDMVRHFMTRGDRGKAMVVAVDRFTAVRMYDLVQAEWQRYQAEIKERLATTPPDAADALLDDLNFMRETDMAVVISSAQNEVSDFAARGLDIATHRERMMKEELDEKFKQADDRLRIVFVCAMWITGFDVPSLTTLYLDKPLKNHTLMQTIARANRVFAGKTHGLIVDYLGIFRNLKKALAIYAAGAGGDMPIQEKQELINELESAKFELLEFAGAHQIDLRAIGETPAAGFARAELLDRAINALLARDDVRDTFRGLAIQFVKLYKAVLPDSQAHAFAQLAATTKVILNDLAEETEPVDVSEVMGKISAVLDEAIHVDRVREPRSRYGALDLSKINFDALAEQFAAGKKHIARQRLQNQIQGMLAAMIRENPTRREFLERFEALIADYNNGSLGVEALFDQLVKLAGELDEENQRAVREGLDEKSLAVFDLLTKPAVELSEKERAQVKQVAAQLITLLESEKLVLDWTKKQETRAAVRLTIAELLDQLPDTYSRKLYSQKCDAVYQFVHERFSRPESL